MRLYIAEKPSMGAEIAKCLPGPLRRGDGFMAAGDWVVTWVFGHIMRQAEPYEYDEKYRRWRMEDLPIIPDTWKLLVDPSCEKQFRTICGLIDRADEIVHAGDPDREGQLLIDEVLDYVGTQKPVKRILVQALDEKSIHKALGDLRENADFFNLKSSALARARADWLIGMNLSRAYTIAAQRAGHRVTLPIGRVKTPTLALVVRREREIENFVPVDYYTIKAEFSHENGAFAANWKPGDEQKGIDTEGRLVDLREAEQLLARFAAGDRKAEIAVYDTVEKKEPQRLPFSLSSLQVLAGKRYGYEPQMVLDAAQRLYEKKLTTYPRSDCEYLPENQRGDASVILGNLEKAAGNRLAAWAAGADQTIRSRAWNDKKISAHHAIIPTQAPCNASALPEVERNLYEMIAQAYIAQFYPVHIYDQTRVEVLYEAERFTTGGRVVKQAGWRELYGAEADEDKAEKDDKKEKDETARLPAMRRGDAATYLDANLARKTTKPPSRFTASTLLAGMKEIHKYVKNPDSKKMLKDVYGIGTEATRATIIQELITRGFMRQEAKKKYLVPTDAAYLLVDALPDEMTYPDSTAIWEDCLHSMSMGGARLDAFLQAQTEFTRLLCQKAEGTKIPLSGAYPCPVCKKGVMQKRQGKNGVFWGCTNYPRCRATTDDDDGKPKAMPQPVLCPRCKEGALRLINGRNGAFWGCSNYPACTSTYNDLNGKPNLG